jgi:hypothetical protein
MTANLELAKQQGLTEDTITAINILHKRLDAILARPTMFSDEKDVARIVESYEFVLQSLWGFSLDKNYHRYWFKVANCLCPELDNRDRIGTPYRVINPECIFHGDLK